MKFIIVIIFLSSFFLLTTGRLTKIFYKLPIIDNAPNCSKLYQPNADIDIIKAAKNWKNERTKINDDSQIDKDLDNCDYFLKMQHYFLDIPKTEDEKNLRIAFSMVIFKNVSQIERLLRTIYRPWNYYCIHIDLKSDKNFLNTIGKLVNCLNGKFHNIINTKNRIDVQWGTMSVLTADLNCMKELYESYKDWKYLINLTGQEFPLKTNAELAKILTAYKGANNLEGTYTRRNMDRVPKVDMPFPLIWYKGSVHITANRDFVRFIFESPKSTILLNALKDRSVPDEQFFSTLNHNVQLRIPGSFIGDPDEGAIPNEPLVHFLTRYKNWGEYSCASGMWVRQICIWGVGDLPKLVRAPHLFTNKFYEDFQPATLHCMEKWYYDKVEQEIKTGQIAINSSFYSSMPFVKYRYIPPIE